MSRRSGGGGVVSLAMYPFPWLRDATEQLWHDIAALIGSDRPLAEWGEPTEGAWDSPTLVLSQTCAWPLVTHLAHRVRPLGSFRYVVDGVADDHYRSVIIRRAHATGEPARPGYGLVAAVNQMDSLSGWVSLRHVVQPDARIPTGAHVESLAAVAEGRADIASIDAVTFAHVAAHDPDRVRGVEVVGRGPRVPTLPLITRATATDAEVAALRTALGEASRGDAATELLIDGFTAFDLADYQHVATLPC